MKIMEEVSKILGIYVTGKSIDKDVEVMEKTGMFTQRKLRELIVMIIKKLDEVELDFYSYGREKKQESSSI